MVLGHFTFRSNSMDGFRLILTLTNPSNKEPINTKGTAVSSIEMKIKKGS